MNHHATDKHLADHEVLRAVIDPSDLGPARQAHLDACRQCRQRTEALTRRYRSLGRVARQMVPEPHRSFRIPAQGAPSGRWYLKPALALGVMGVLVFMVTLWAPVTRLSHPPAPVAVHQFENDAQMMEAIDTLVEDALPEKYQRLAALSDDRSVDDLDAFMEWMVPVPAEAHGLEQPAASGRESRHTPLARPHSTIRIEASYEAQT